MKKEDGGREGGRSGSNAPRPVEPPVRCGQGSVAATPAAFIDEEETIADGPEVADVWVKEVRELHPDTWCYHCQRRHGGLLVILSQDPDSFEWLRVVEMCGAYSLDSREVKG